LLASLFVDPLAKIYFNNAYKNIAVLNEDLQADIKNFAGFT